ncbi:MAG: hypothetical protein QNJ45_16750 [Ardenticatenaceae bacterium]|nr:hypothetical protein [Ardenticatenaceae bacterium]
MSKKVRRVKRSSGEQRKKSEATSATPNRRQIGGVGKTPSRRSRRGRIRQVPIEELKEQYAYVIKDLRRIFILAIVMFVLLFLANLFLPSFF